MSTTSSGRKLLPIATPCEDNACFFGGDERVLETPQLTLMHTLWAREHNRVADRLAQINPTWNDQQLYMEARRIVTAELEHVTYNEYLPTVLSA